jgi:D-alanyl-D-alanine carboxypeptidase
MASKRERNARHFLPYKSSLTLLNPSAVRYPSTFKSISLRYVIVAICLFTGTAVVPSAAARAPSPISSAVDFLAIDRLIEKEMAARNIPGLSLAIVRRGELVYSKGFGVANLEHAIPATPDTVFAIASVSKPILAIAIGRLVEQGKLSWRDPISKYLPSTPESWRNVTIAHLANHTSGIVRESPKFDENAEIADFELIEATFGVALAFPTGTKMQYCNICYFALAETITRVTGEPWPKFVKRELFDVAGMRDTRTTSVRDLVAKRAASYAWKNGSYSNVREYVALRPSGAFLSTVVDLARFESAFYNGKLVSAKTIATLTTPTQLADGEIGRMGNDPFGYGLGWDVGTLDGQLRVAHGGSLAGFRTMYARYPESGWAVILLANSTTTRSFSLERLVAKLLPMD